MRWVENIKTRKFSPVIMRFIICAKSSEAKIQTFKLFKNPGLNLYLFWTFLYLKFSQKMGDNLIIKPFIFLIFTFINSSLIQLHDFHKINLNRLKEAINFYCLFLIGNSGKLYEMTSIAKSLHISYHQDYTFLMLLKLIQTPKNNRSGW